MTNCHWKIEQSNTSIRKPSIRQFQLQAALPGQKPACLGRTMTRFLSVSGLLVAALSIASPALATVFIPVTFDELVTSSQVIVLGRVLSVEAEMTADRRTISPLVTLDVAGRLGRYRRVVVGAPVFSEGEEAVVFLTARAPSMPYLFGLSQGVYRVGRGVDGHVVVTPPMVEAGSVVERVVRGDPARRPLAVDDFVTRVRVVAGRTQ